MNNVNIRKYRVALTRLRVSSHRLEIETGRWHKPQKNPLSDRKCQLCNTLEDEFHFILECPLYHEYRQVYMKPYYWRKPNIPKFVELMTSHNVKVVRNLSMFIFNSFKKRTEVYYF